MGGRRGFDRVMLRAAVVTAALVCIQNLSVCWCLNREGLALIKFRERVVRDPYGALSNWNDHEGEMDPCSWFGVECSDGKVVILNLRDLCLGGTLAPELGNLSYVKSIILRNNSFSGNVPKEIGELKELEELDLGYNNFSGPFPPDFGNNMSLTILLLDNNKFLGSISPELYELKMLSELQVDQKRLSNADLEATCHRRSIHWNVGLNPPNARRLLLMVDAPNPHYARSQSYTGNSELSSSPSLSSSSSSSWFATSMLPPDAPLSSISFPPLTSPSSFPESPSSSPFGDPTQNFLIPSPSPESGTASPTPANPPIVVHAQPPSHSAPAPSRSASMPSPALTPKKMVDTGSKFKHRTVLALCGVLGASMVIFVSAIGIMFCRSSKVVTVKPWATGLSGQLQKAFVSGVPKLKRFELETACEDFSNIIGSLSNVRVYKGTLSSGVEIAVTSSALTNPEDWTKNLKAQFREEIDTLSRLSHKNFVNLIGYCEEEEPFTRMMVFEYAPNGTLCEHLHVKEAEHLDWAMRLRIAMGTAYCLDYMHQLTPPIFHRNLQSSSVYLTEDYAAKVSDFSFWNKVTAAKKGSAATELLDTPAADPEGNIYRFGVILLEMVTGRLAYSVGSGSLTDWACDYLNGNKPSREMVDPTLKSIKEDELEKLLQVVKICIHPDPEQRPTMREVTAKLREITDMEPDGATPKLSPLWWAEVEIMSSEAS
ncbi:inactive receptor-like serine/threonine-protein kinase At2g40270 isoform X2 [Malania oleifera]|uniref:inactive receptor-like serine/threonine-protein kinase At2g40270 isoform X2 n=1 Tax=Malania oleifera TaxID=397392 RepID=UPI0025AE8365|nr:inactive receptor-like serine/threonine-protein kinase At2g40270 isoform X2 [Malania oleifera]